MRRSSGFTLIELLVVIAIIAILAAIIFPVFVQAKISAYRSSDMSNMNSLRTALQLYRSDQGGYPPALLGYATLYTDGSGDIVPANSVRGFLYPRRVDSVATFKPALNRADDSKRVANNAATRGAMITRAEWPNQDPRGAGSAPIMDLDGNGTLDTNDDPGFARQAYGPGTVVTRANFPYSQYQDIDAAGAGATDVDAWFYNVSGYDVATVKTPGGPRTELRYALFWTNWGLAANGASAGSINDDPRQLGYADPPENTVVTWNSFFRDYDSGGVVKRQKNDLVLFIGGNARPMDSKNVSDYSWRLIP